MKVRGAPSRGSPETGAAWLNFAVTGRNHHDFSIESEGYISFLDSSRECPRTVESAWLNRKTGPSSMILLHVVFRTNLVSHYVQVRL